jgi:hypothetical protein
MIVTFSIERSINGWNRASLTKSDTKERQGGLKYVC